MKKVMVLFVLVVCLVSFNASAGIVAEWGFETGDARDTSGNGYDGELQDGTTIVMDAERGLVADVTGGNGIYVANSWDTVDGTGANTWISPHLTQSNTFMCWYKMDAWGAAWAPQLLWKGNDFQLSQRNTTVSWRWTAREITNAGPQAMYNSLGTEANGQWHHVAGVTDVENGVLKIYVDGVRLGWDGVLYNDLKLVNSNVFVARLLVGRIDDVIFFDEALDAAAIQSYMSYSVPEPATMLLLGVGGAVLLRRRRA